MPSGRGGFVTNGTIPSSFKADNKQPLQVEHVHSKHDITCHSKSRRNKKKKIPLVNNEEVKMASLIGC